MLRRLTHALVALIIAFAATMPAGARAMPMQAGPMDAGTGHPCQQCPDRSMPDPMSGKMTPCPMLVCAGPLVVLPTAGAIGTRIVHRVAYPVMSPARFAGADPAPDPLPPRPVVLL